jgi:hypothetical protein
MRIIASKQNEFGSRTYVVLSAGKIWLAESTDPFETQWGPSINNEGVVYKKCFTENWESSLHKKQSAYSLRELRRASVSARAAMRRHR